MFTLGRKIDINYSTNRIIVILSVVSFIVGWIYTGDFLPGFSIGLAVFLSWAITREVDPGHEYSAFIAAALTFLNLFYFRGFSLVQFFWVLLILRAVNGITGKELTAFDITFILVLTIYLSFKNTNSIYLILFIIAMAIIIIFKERTSIALFASGIAFATFIIEIFFLKYLEFNMVNVSNAVTIFMVTSIFLFTFLSAFQSKDEIKDDVGNSAKKSKIRSGQILFSLIVIVLMLFDVEPNNLITYISIMLGVIICFTAHKILSKKG